MNIYKCVCVLGVFLSFEGTYIKLYFVEGWNVNNLFVFLEIQYFISEILNFSGSIEKFSIDGWYIYFKITKIFCGCISSSIHFYVDVRTRRTMSSCHIRAKRRRRRK